MTRPSIACVVFLLCVPHVGEAQTVRRSPVAPAPQARFSPLRRLTRPLQTGPIASRQLRDPFRVAAIQYASGEQAKVPGATSDLEAITALVRQAHAGGAKLVVAPEYGLGEGVELLPHLRANPGMDGRWPAGSTLRAMSSLSRQLGIYLVADVLTARAGQARTFNTQVAFDPTGAVVAVHRKFNLFGEENGTLTPGDSVCTFNTPAGRVGLLICADVYGDRQGDRERDPNKGRLLRQLVNGLSPRMVAFSSWWTVDRPNEWHPHTIQSEFARDACVYLLAANTTAGPGRGGGIWDPHGRPLARSGSDQPSVVFADIERCAGR